MKKKGFTLIELLTVIVVLSIIFSISVPKILDIVEKSRRKVFFTSATSIVNTVKTEYFQNLYNKNFEYKAYEFDKKYPSGYKQNSETLKLKGDLPSIGTVKLKDNGKIALAVVSHDERYCAKKDYSDAEVKVEDYVFGKCNLEEDGAIIGEEFKINITSTPKDYLEETKEGWSRSKEVTITHNADDRAKLQYQLGTTTGKWIDYDDKFELEQNTTIYARLYTSTNSIESSLKVTTIDREGPSITEVSGNPTEWTKEDVKLTATANDKQSGLAIKKAAYSFDKGTTWQASNIKKYSSNTDGIVIKVRDKAGNVTTYSPIAITKIDKTPPVCGEWNGQNTRWTNQNVIVYAQCSDSGSGCKTLQSKGVLITGTTIRKQVSAVIEDNVGNTTTCSGTVNAYIDQTPPTCTSSGGSNAWTNDSRTLVGTCYDGESGCKGNASWFINWQGNWQNLSPGKVFDNVGNSTECPANQIVRIDQTSPTISELEIKGVEGTVLESLQDTAGSTTAYLYSSITGVVGTPPYISYSATDGEGSGIKSRSISCTGNNIDLLNGNRVYYKGKEGYTNVYCKVTVTDNVGNEATAPIDQFKVGSGWMAENLGDINNEKWYYYDASSRQLLTGLQQLKWKKNIPQLGERFVTRTDTYYFGSKGLMLKGFQNVDGNNRFFVCKSADAFELPEGSMLNASVLRDFQDYSLKNKTCFCVNDNNSTFYKIDRNGIAEKLENRTVKNLCSQCQTINQNCN